MKILVPGGASYIGSWLVPQLLADGHEITVYDTLMFGDGFLPKDNGNLKIVKADLRDLDSWKKACEGQEVVIFLASISRELLCQQQPELAQSVNVDAFEPCVKSSKEAGVNRFIYASSVAVYGSSEVPLKEDSPLQPTTIYGQGKKACEEILLSHQGDNFTTIITRSASVCGYAPRMRLDLTLNRMVHDAVRKGKITIEGGSQIRSHISIRDLSDFYKLILTYREDFVGGQAFNVVSENQSILQSAKMIKSVLRERLIPLETKPRVDDRSYAIDGSKVSVLGFATKYGLEYAIRDMVVKLDSGHWKDSLTNPIYQNMA